jgi:biopolymer transport protein ExbB/TolQ
MIIQQVGDISPSILAGGLKVAFISTMYGLIIYIFSLGLMTLSKE